MAAELAAQAQVFLQLADLVDGDLLLAFRRLHPPQIRMGTGLEQMTTAAALTGLAGRVRMQAEQRRCPGPGEVVLADPAGAAQQIGMRQPVLLLRQLQAPPDRILPGMRRHLHGLGFRHVRGNCVSHGEKK